MGLLDWLVAGGTRAQSPGAGSDFWYQPVGYGPSQSGLAVDSETARKISAWYRGRDLLATCVAMLPLRVMERLPNDAGAKPAKGNPLYDILHDSPNGYQDSFGWRRQLMYHLIDHGNAYCLIRPGQRGAVDQLWPMDPMRMTAEIQPTRRVLYRFRRDNGMSDTYTQDEIFHLRGASDDGVTGKGVLAYARDSVGLALAQESYAQRLFSQGALHGGVISVPGLLDEAAAKRMAESFVSGQSKWHMPKVLEQGASYAESSMTPEDAQMILSRKTSVDDIARWLGVPRHMLENSDPSFGNAEQFNENFVTFSMGPWLSLFEFAANRQLVLAPRRFFVEFTRDAIARGTLAERWAAHVAAVNAGIKTVDEARAVESLPKMGGQAAELRVPQNITGKPMPESVMRQDEDDEALERARAVTQESAARLLRKEAREVAKLGVRFADNDEAFAVAVTDFYAKHVALVMESLLMSEPAAQAYCAGQASQVLSDGVAATESWQTRVYSAGVAALALEAA